RTAGPGPSSRLFLPRVVDRLRSTHDDLQIQLKDVGRHRVSADRLLLADPGSDGMKADAAAQEEALPSRPGQVGPHRKSVFVAPSRDLKLVTRQADVQAVEVLPDLLADERVRVMTRDVFLVRLPGLRVGDDRLELRHGIPWREMRPCGAFT